jgi:hypothetical protein
VDLGAHLAHQDIAGLDELAGVALDAAALAGTVPAIPGTATSFFMCHEVTPGFLGEGAKDWFGFQRSAFSSQLLYLNFLLADS